MVREGFEASSMRNQHRLDVRGVQVLGKKLHRVARGEEKRIDLLDEGLYLVAPILNVRACQEVRLTVFELPTAGVAVGAFAVAHTLVSSQHVDGWAKRIEIMDREKDR